MSFAYLPLYTGDYLRDTRHLTPMRHGIYLLALMHCWDSQGPMPLDEQESAGICNCRSSDEIDGLRYVLQRFFILMDDGWYNKRMADEVAKAERTSAARSEGGLRSAMARKAKAHQGFKDKATRVELKLNSSSTQAEVQLVSPSPSPSPSQDKKQAAPVVASPKRSDPDMLTENSNGKHPPCPYAEIRAAWCEILPTLRQPLPADNWTAARKALVRARWQRDLPDIDTWRDVFQTVARSRFLTGQCEGRNGGRPFQADLFWICKPENLSKLAEGAYS